MFFILLTFASALFIEGLGSLVSVIGISALFGANPIIIALAISLDVGKVVVVSLLYTYWKVLSKLMKTYALIAASVTMVITSAGAAGYLSGEFQKAILGTKEGELKVSVLKEQQAKYQERKKQIDDQIAALPTKTTVNQRLRLMRGFQTEQKALDAKITEIDKQLPEAQIKQIGTEAKAGPILYVAKAFNVSVEEAVKWVILMIIFVFDPLAIFLIIAGNFLWARRKALQQVGPTVKMTEHKSPTPVVIEEPTSMPVETSYTTYTAPEVPVEVPVSPESKLETPSPTPRDHYGASVRAEPVEPVIEAPEVVQENHQTYVPTGLLKPVIVESPDVENELGANHFTPLVIEQPDAPLVEAGPIEDDVPLHREQITRSSLGMVHPDPNTIVDARRDIGFRKAAAIVTTPTKR